jgi:hypothetical protein
MQAHAEYWRAHAAVSRELCNVLFANRLTSVCAEGAASGRDHVRMTEHPAYPLTVRASCGHSMRVVSPAQQDEFEQDHQERCGAAEFVEETANFLLE